MDNNIQKQTPSILVGINRFLGYMPQIAAVIIGLSGVAYLIGWLYARSYYSVFGAEWLINELPVSVLVSYSWWPVIIVVFYTAMGLSDLCDAQLIGKIEDSGIFKTCRFFIRHSIWPYLILLVSDIITGILGYPAVARIISIFTVTLFIAMTSSALIFIVLRLGFPEFKNRIKIEYLAFGIIIFGLYFTPTQMGKNAALMNKASDSGLSKVIIRDEPEKVYRLLLSSGEKIYIFPDNYDSKYPPISIATIDRIKSIQKSNKSILKFKK